MKISIKVLLVLLIPLAYLIPNTSLAYLSTAQDAKVLNEQNGLFVIEYQFGHKHNDIYLPVVTKRGLAKESTEQQVGFTLREDGEKVKDLGIANGLVLSKAPIVDGMYKIKKGTSQKLWLVVMLTTKKDDPTTNYALQVDKLPFLMGSNKSNLQTLELNSSELQYYKTKTIKLNTTK